MNPTGSNSPESDAVDQLVAYLDGELSEAEAEQVERRLAQDSEYRGQLQRLQQSWDMLDYLPRANVGPAFTKTTVEMVAVRAAGDRRKKRLSDGLQRTGRWIGVLALGLVAFAAGFYVVRHRLDAPNRRLLQDLPVVENVDLYYHADDIQFVEQLESEDFFDVEVEPVGYRRDE